MEPKASFTYEVRLDACNTVGENYHARIPATLGAAAVMIEFDLYAP
ncbi:MAG: hypothetical protein KAI47_14055 [Deltaproteobacteria bacterium]|nr:hypothetical protein [Deltaproteobacteria bacterium]